MNTFSNFSSLNGWPLPGSGAWVTRDIGDFYVDENGDLWVPCVCAATGITGTAEATGTGAQDEAPTGLAGVTALTGASEEAIPPQEMALAQRMDAMLEIVRRLERIHTKELRELDKQ